MTHGDPLRRVSIVERPLGSSLATSTAPIASAGEDIRRDRLVGALEQLAEEVRTGQHAAEVADGVLLDVVIDSIRCLMVEYSPPLLVELSPREKQVAMMVARGRTNQAIANSLEISVWTVSTHIRRIFAKLAVSSRAEMVAHLLDSSEFASQINRPGPW